MARTAYEVQRDFALSSGLRSEIIWDSLSPDQAEILQQKIEALLPDTGRNQKELKKLRKDLFDNVWAQRKYTNRALLSAIIYVLVCEEGESNVELTKKSTQFSVHPVFRTRKCFTNHSNNSAGCCMLFIDEQSRVYVNWQQYLANNVLPKGIMIAPAQGIYNFDDNDEVILELQSTPAACTQTKIANITDKAASVGGLVATVPIAAALAMPVAAPVLAAATVVGLTTAAYSTLRSALQLRDRRRHEQTTALTDRASRNNWLGVATGVVGIGSAGITRSFAAAANAGREMTIATRLTMHGINVSSMVLSGAGIVNGVCDIYIKINDDEGVNGIDVLQLASSLIVFTHSLNNYKIATKAVASRNGSTMRSVLRNQMRNIFDKISKQTAKFGNSVGKFDIIRTVNDIPLKDVLANLHKINAHLQSGSNMSSAVQGIATSLLPKFILSLNSTLTGNSVNLAYLAEEFGAKFTQHIVNVESFIDVINAMAKHLCDTTFRLLLNLARIFIDNNVDTIDRTLNTFVSTETVLYKILMNCVTKYTDFSYDFMESQTTEILQQVDNYFKSLNPVVADAAAIKNCRLCKGQFYICKL